MDRITQLLKQIHETADTPVKMSSGGTVTEQVYGQTRSTPYSMSEYLSGSMYDFPGINVDVAPAAGDPTDNTQSNERNVLDPVGTGDIGSSGPFTSYSVATGLPSFGYEDIDPVDFISKFEKTSPKAKGRSDDSFLKFGINQLDPKNIPLGVASLAIPGAGVFGIAAAELNRRSQKKTADAIMATGKTGGSMYKFQGQTVHRLPGTKQFNGTLGNMTSAEHYRFDEIRRGFIPGTMVETARTTVGPAGQGDNEFVRTGKNTIAYDEGFGAGMDAFGTIHSASGPQGGSASAATALREQLYRDNMNRLGLTIDESRVASEALAMKQALDAGMRNSRFHGGFTHKASNLSDEDYANAQTLSQKIIQQHIRTNTAAGKAQAQKDLDARRRAAEQQAAAAAKQKEEDDKRQEEINKQAEAEAKAYKDDPGMFGDDDDDTGSSAGSSSQDFSDSGSSGGGNDYGTTDFDVGQYMRQGGRVGLQMGGTAPQAAPAGFVERPPSQVSEAATVADDKPMSVPEGTFVINAAAVEIAGEADIAKMLNKAYKSYRARGGKEVMGRTPSKEEIDVAVSRGEVLVPPAIAKIIGYDRLEKINNRGKKETKERIEENGQGRRGAVGGGFLARKKLGIGGEAIDDLEEQRTYQASDFDIATVNPRGDEYVKQGIPDYAFATAKMLGVGDDVNRALAVAKAYDIRYQPKDDDKARDTLRHILVSGYMHDQDSSPEFMSDPVAATTGFFKRTGESIASELFDSREAMSGDFPEESAIDLNNNKFGRALRQKFPDKDEFTRAAIAVVEMLRQGEAYEVDGFKPQMSIGYSMPTKMSKGGQVLPTPKPGLVERRQDEAIADVELRADLEEFVRDDQLARLGWELYTSGELRVAGLPTPFDYSRVIQDDGTETVRDRIGYGFSGVYNPAPGKNKKPIFAKGQGFSKEQEAKTETLNPSTTPNKTISPLLSKVGITPSKTPTASYFSEPMYIPSHARTYEGIDMGDRATVMITLAHELRHAAMNYMHYDLGAPLLTRSQEERMMDVMDERSRRKVSKKNSLVLAESPYRKVAQRGDVAKYMIFSKKQVELYNNLAAEVLKEKGVPPVAKREEKGFISKYIDDLFGKSNAKKKDKRPVDYKSEALQSPQF